MPKTIKWSSFAENDFALLLEYLETKWNRKVCNHYIEEIDYCIIHIQKNPKQFPFMNKELQIRKCVISKHNSIFYRDTINRIEILRIYDTRQNPDDLKFY
jgi:plasmid stabilization system protein ParE